jgi:uncharacterized membrane protein
MLERVERHASFSGPLPPPELFEEYERILPGSAHRLLTLAERQSAHRQRLEASTTEGGLKFRSRGQWLAFAVILAGLIIGGFLAYHDKSLEGLGTMLLTLGGIVTALIYSRTKNGREEPGDDEFELRSRSDQARGRAKET